MVHPSRYTEDPNAKAPPLQPRKTKGGGWGKKESVRTGPCVIFVRFSCDDSTIQTIQLIYSTSWP